MKPAAIARLRRDLQLTQPQFAKLLCVADATVNRWENGRTEPQPLVLEVLAALRIANKGSETLKQKLASVSSSKSSRARFLRDVFVLAYGAA